MRHAQDHWLDRAPSNHRVFFDTWLADKFGGAVSDADNWTRYNKEAYGLTDGPEPTDRGPGFELIFSKTAPSIGIADAHETAVELVTVPIS
jgi:hypothetical protein